MCPNLWEGAQLIFLIWVHQHRSHIHTVLILTNKVRFLWHIHNVANIEGCVHFILFLSPFSMPLSTSTFPQIFSTSHKHTIWRIDWWDITSMVLSQSQSGRQHISAWCLYIACLFIVQALAWCGGCTCYALDSHLALHLWWVHPFNTCDDNAEGSQDWVWLTNCAPLYVWWEDSKRISMFICHAGVLMIECEEFCMRIFCLTLVGNYTMSELQVIKLEKDTWDVLIMHSMVGHWPK